MKEYRKGSLLKTTLTTALLLAVALLSLFVSRRRLEAHAGERTASALSSAASEQCATIVSVLNGQYEALRAIAGLLPADAEAVRSALLRVPLPQACTDLLFVPSAGEVVSRSGNAADAAAVPSPAGLSESGTGMLVRAADGAAQLSLFVPASTGLLCCIYEATLLDALLVDRVYAGATRICIVGNGTQVLAANARARDYGLVAGSDLLQQLEARGMLAADGSRTVRQRLAAMQPDAAALSEQGAEAYLVYRPVGTEDWFLAMIAPPAAIQSELSRPLNALYLLSAILFTGALALFIFLIYSQRHQLALAWRARAQEFAKLSTRAQTDALTGLLNRGAAEQHIRRYLADEGRSGRHALLMLDLDDFKGVNDTFGHIAGDDMLVAIGKRLRACVRLSDVVSRFGGDEFVILLKDAGGDEKILSVADKIGQTVGEGFAQDQLRITISVSIGVAVYDADGKGFSQLYGEADRALYRAKDAGKERIVFFDPSMA